MNPRRFIFKTSLRLFAAATLAAPFCPSAKAQTFTSSNLQGTAVNTPSGLQFGPDGRLYVCQADGTIKAYNVVRNGPNNYSVTATEIISLIHDIPNREDNTGAVNPNVVGR